MEREAKIDRERRWRGHLAAWRSSRVSQAAYCRREGLTAHDFSWWKRELARRDRCAAMAAPSFVPVRVSPPPIAPYAFELALRGGRVLRFEACVNPATLGAVVGVLEAAQQQPKASSC